MSDQPQNETLQKLKQIQNHLQTTGQSEPNWMGTFQKFMQASKKEGALSSKMKELIGVALSVKAQCDRCIVWHVKNALDHGATSEEIIEAAQVAVIMSGGPGLMALEDVRKAIKDLQQ